MAKIILHIGGEKTGTSYLQRFLCSNAAPLMRRHGVLYPKHPLVLHNRAHYPLVAALLPPAECDFIADGLRPSLDEAFGALLALIARKSPRTVILSAEHFSSRLERPAIAELARRLAGHQVHVVFYVRRQDDLAISRLSTALKCGERGWLDLDGITPGNRYFNPLPVIDDWRAVFGADAIAVRSYAAAARGDLAGDLLGQAGLGAADVTALRKTRRTNERISLTEARILHQLNQGLLTWQEAVDKRRIDEYVQANRLRCKLITWLREERPETQQARLDQLLAWEQRERLMQSFAGVNRALIDAHGLPPGDFAPLKPNGRQELAEPPMTSVLADAIGVLGQRLLHGKRRRRNRLANFARALLDASTLHIRNTVMVRLYW